MDTSFTDTQRQIQLALRRTALLYHHFVETLVKELGDEKGEELVFKAVNAYGEHIGEEAKKTAESQGLPLTPENFSSDLPDSAWKTEVVEVEGEERVRVHHCPLAAEWLEWSDPRRARIYCFVDQAKMQGYNPDYEYIHTQNLLDGDPFCELVVRPIVSASVQADSQAEGSTDTVRWIYGTYTRNDLKNMDPDCLRALFRERIHHTIEVHLYPHLREGKTLPPNFGRQPQLILDVWRERGLPEDGADFGWGKHYLKIAETLRTGKVVQVEEPQPQAFTAGEMAVVKKLIWNRHSIRDWIPGKKIPEHFITEILEAGRAAPCGCNMNIVRFVVIRDPDEARMVWSDIPTPMDRCVLIVICYDTRIYKTVGHDKLVPHNQLYDCAAAADHMCLMAHALGLGAVWLTRTEKTAGAFKEKYKLPDHIEPALHIAVGWPAGGTIKSGRLPLEDMLITKKT
jgi:nitroreductase